MMHPFSLKPGETESELQVDSFEKGHIFDLAFYEESAHVPLLDLSGRLIYHNTYVKEREADKSELSIPLPGYLAGTYFVKYWHHNSYSKVFMIK